jgi:hypothetical protein
MADSTLEQEIVRDQRAHLEAAIGPSHAAVLQPIFRHLLPLYAANEAVARRWQLRFNRTAIAIYALSALAVTVSIVQLLFWSGSNLLVYGEIALMVLALGLIFVSRRGQWQSRWLHSRHVAERLRVAMFVSAIPDFVRPLPNPAELQKHYKGPRPELLQSLFAALAHGDLKSCWCGDVAVLRNYLVKGLIRDQAHYHEKAGKRRHRSSHFLEGALILFFGITLLAAVLHAAHVVHDEHHLTVLLSISLPAWAAAIHGINDQLDHERIAERSHNMAHVLEALAVRMEQADSLEAIGKVAAEVEWVMLSENLEWLVSSSFRKPPVVAV